jgi:ClpP class serine protease
MEYGLVDELGSVLDAIDRAAELANLEHYEIVAIQDEYLTELQQQGSEAEYQTALDLYAKLESQPDEFDLSTEQVEWPTFYQIYIPLE